MKKTILLGVGVVILWSCNRSEKAASSEAAAVHTENHAEHEHDQNSDAVELNNGEKWAVNEEMKPFVQKGEELVSGYIQDGKADYKVLASQLQEQNTQLIKSCTMDGKSHDELHKWLHPHLEIVKALAEEADATKSNEIVLKLQHSYQQYHEYFN